MNTNSQVQATGDNILETSRLLATGDIIILRADDIRSERTGLHAHVSIFCSNKLAASDVFNVARNEERARLAKSAFAYVPPLAQKEYTLAHLKHELDLFCEDIRPYWESHRFTDDLWDIDEDVPPIEYVLRPYILRASGTICFAKPGSLKSYWTLLLALSIASGKEIFWPVKQSPVYYVNLERSAISVRRRLAMLCRWANLNGRSHNVVFLNAKGMSLATVSKKIKAFTDAHPGAVVFLDSISRAGYGTLVDDDIANKITDVLNASAPTWIGIGHTPRADNDHTYGSIMFDCGEDTGIKLAAESRGTTVGLAIEVVKANDMAFPPIAYMAFDFSDTDDDGNSELINVRMAKANEFPKLLLAEKTDDFTKVVAYLTEVNFDTATNIAEKTGCKRSNVARLLTQKTDTFCRAGKHGRDVFYALVDRQHADV